VGKRGSGIVLAFHFISILFRAKLGEGRKECEFDYGYCFLPTDTETYQSGVAAGHVILTPENQLLVTGQIIN
jgi:hypothetical protein